MRGYEVLNCAATRPASRFRIPMRGYEMYNIAYSEGDEAGSESP